MNVYLSLGHCLVSTCSCVSGLGGFELRCCWVRVLMHTSDALVGDKKCFPTVGRKLMAHVRRTGHVGRNSNSRYFFMVRSGNRAVHTSGLLLVPLLSTSPLGGCSFYQPVCSVGPRAPLLNCEIAVHEADQHSLKRHIARPHPTR